MSAGPRNARIDLLRGVSIVLVLLHHFNIAYPLRDTALARVLAPLRWSGWLSYELYLFHMIVLGTLRTFWPPSATHGDGKLALLVAYLVLSAGLSAVIARAVSIICPCTAHACSPPQARATAPIRHPGRDRRPAPTSR